MKKELHWLYSQLPELVDKGIIDSNTAQRLREHYGSPSGEGRRTWLTIFGMIGALLIGLGIILILAHNWQQLTRFNRMLIAVGVLIVAQAFAAFSLWRREDSRPWLEGSATFLMLMVGASMALVGQTYHLTDDTGSFLLIWMVLSLPLIYLFRSVVATLLYIVGITAWVLNGTAPVIGKHLVWLLLAGVVPYCRNLLLDASRVNQAVVVTWVFTLSLYVSFGAAFDRQIGQLGILLFVALFSLTYLVGVLQLAEHQGSSLWRRPLVAIGLAGTTVLSFVLTFQGVWQGMLRSAVKTGEIWLALVLLVPVMVLSIIQLRQHGKQQALYVAAPIFVGIAYLLQMVDPSGISAAVLMNAFMLLFGIALLIRGIGQGNLTVLNFGMLIIAALIMARFVDINFSFIVRGLVFIGLGACFLTVNWLAARRKAGEKDD